LLSQAVVGNGETRYFFNDINAAMLTFPNVLMSNDGLQIAVIMLN
jgi:hypothetical protein